MLAVNRFDAVADRLHDASVHQGSFEDIYRQHYAAVWRSARRLGVGEGELDDLVQEVFVIAHRKLPQFEGRSTIGTWLFGITYRVVRDLRRSAAARARREALATGGRPPTEPDRRLSRVQAATILDELLATLEDEQREVLVMAEIMHMTAPQIAELTEAKLNTVYSRLRLARRAFEAELAKYRERTGGELPWMS